MFSFRPLIMALLLMCLPSLAAYPAPLQNNQIMDGVNVDMCLINPASADYVLNSKHEDLIDIAHHLGINLFRITDGGCVHDNVAVDKNAWSAVLKKMKVNGITAIVTTEPPRNGDDWTPDTVKYITSLVIDNKLGSYDNVYGIDLFNEPVLDDNNVVLIKDTIRQIKAAYPDLRLSIGGWRTTPGTGSCPATHKGKYCWNKAEDGKAFSGLLDYYSAHIYGYDGPMNGPYPDAFMHTTQFLDTMLPFAEGKPVIIEEYGADNGTAVSDQSGLGTPELQANVTDGVLRAVRAYQGKNVTGSTQWVFYNRSYQHGTPGWELVSDNGDTIFSAAYVIQKDSTGVSDKPVTIPMPITATAHLFQYADNGASVPLHQGDIAGFLLEPAKPGNYKMIIDDPSFFIQTEPFIYIKGRHYYVATLHAKAPGTTAVSVVEDGCVTNCQPFRVTLTVLPGK